MYVCFALFVAVSASVSCKFWPRLSVGVYYAGMSANFCRLLYHHKRFKYRFRFGSFGLVRVVTACSPFTSTHCADDILCRCHLQGVPRSLWNAARPTLFAITALPPLWSIIVRVELLTRLFVCAFSRGRRVYMCCADLAGIGVIRLWLFPFCNAKLQRVLYIYQTKIRFSA